MTRSETFRAASLTLALAAVLAASSCAAPFNDGSVSTDPQQNHPITVAAAYKTMRVPFGGAAAGLRPDDEARLAGFVHDYLAAGNGSISITAPKDGAEAGAFRYFAERLADMGVPRSRILVGTRDADDGDARVELGFITYTAQTDPCGDWSKNVANTASNLPVPNFGCATQHNIAAMVADPRDLMEPRALGPSDAMRRTTVMENYEKGVPTAATKTSDQSGAVTSMGSP